MSQPDGGGPGLARRLIISTVIALVLGGSTALAIGYLGGNDRPTARPGATKSPTGGPTYQPAVLTPSTGTSPSPSPSLSPSAHRAPAPRTTTRVPAPSSARPSSSPPHVPMYQVPKDGLCRYVDFSAMTSIDTLDPKHDKPEVVDGTKPGDGTGSLFYTCLGGVGNVGIRLMGVTVYPDRQHAYAAWADEKSTDAPADMDPVPGLGDDAFGFYISDPTAYKLVVVKTNLFVMVDLQTANPPTRAKWITVTSAMARSILAKLPAS